MERLANVSRQLPDFRDGYRCPRAETFGFIIVAIGAPYDGGIARMS